MNISTCGLVCDECPFFKNGCDGCFNVIGKPFWTADTPGFSICPLFDCAVNQRKYRHCGDCEELPCQKFYDLKDPNSTEEEHLASIAKRKDQLKRP
jgi:hypothetical protein